MPFYHLLPRLDVYSNSLSHLKASLSASFFLLQNKKSYITYSTNKYIYVHLKQSYYEQKQNYHWLFTKKANQR